MRNKILTIILVFLIIINLATIGTYICYQSTAKFAPPDFLEFGPPDSVQRRFRNERFRPNREDMVKLHEHITGFHKETFEIRQTIANLERNVFDLMQEQEPDTALIFEKIDQVHQLKHQLSKKAIKNMILAKSLLSPEQQRHFLRGIMNMGPGPGKPFGADRMEHMRNRKPIIKEKE